MSPSCLQGQTALICATLASSYESNEYSPGRAFCSLPAAERKHRNNCVLAAIHCVGSYITHDAAVAAAAVAWFVHLRDVRLLPVMIKLDLYKNHSRYYFTSACGPVDHGGIIGSTLWTTFIATWWLKKKITLIYASTFAKKKKKNNFLCIWQYNRPRTWHLSSDEKHLKTEKSIFKKTWTVNKKWTN